MPFKKKPQSQDYDTFALQNHPKRACYKKINPVLRQKLINLVLQKRISISEISKRYRINHSTIAYIVRRHKQQNLISKNDDILSGQGDQVFKTSEKSERQSFIIKSQEQEQQIKRQSQKNEGLSEKSLSGSFIQPELKRKLYTFNCQAEDYPFYPFIDYECY